MSWPPFKPPLLLFYDLVQLMLLSAAGFPLFIFMWMYKALCHPGPNLPKTSGTIVSRQTIRLALRWVNKWTTSTSGWGGQGD